MGRFALRGMPDPGNRSAVWYLILNARSGTLQSTVRMPADKDRFFAPYCIVFSPNGRTLLAGHYDGTLRLWDTATGKERASFQSDGDVIWGIDVSRDGRHAVTGSSNGTVRVWELDTGKEAFRGGAAIVVASRQVFYRTAEACSPPSNVPQSSGR